MLLYSLARTNVIFMKQISIIIIILFLVTSCSDTPTNSNSLKNDIELTVNNNPVTEIALQYSDGNSSSFKIGDYELTNNGIIIRYLFDDGTVINNYFIRYTSIKSFIYFSKDKALLITLK